MQQGLLRAALCQPPDPAPSCPCESRRPIEGRHSHGDGKELCLLRPHWLQCQRRGAFKGHFWLGRPTRPQIQNKNRSSAPDGLAALVAQDSLVEPKRQAAGARWARHLVWSMRPAAYLGTKGKSCAQTETAPAGEENGHWHCSMEPSLPCPALHRVGAFREGPPQQTDPYTQQGHACYVGTRIQPGTHWATI